MNNKKVFICVPNLTLPGGVGNFYSVSRKYFSKNVKYLTFNSSYSNRLLKIMVNPLHLIKVLINILFFLPDVVVVNPSLGRNSLLRDGLIVFWGVLLKRKVVVFWRGWNPGLEFLFDRLVYKFLFNLGYKKSNTHIVLNQYIFDTLVAKGVNQDCIKFSNTIVDDSFFDGNTVTKDESKFVILFLTRIEKYKGIYETLEVFRRLEGNVELHIAGSGSELEKIKSIVVDDGIENVKFLGFVSEQEKINAYKQSDMYIFPSYSEGMPNSVLEAMACGLPIVCTRVGALNDFFENGKMGFSSELPVNIETFRKNISCIMDSKSLKNEISHFNIDFSKSNFRASTSISKLEKLFTGV
jgi:glycosyltransferase involved in cell wall biosynthesis